MAVNPSNAQSLPKPAKFVSPRTVALYGILAALTTAITYASYTPFSPTKGYFNLGESMVFFSALVFGWRAGAICGGIGSAAADILLGWGMFAPLTLVAKGAEGLIAGAIGRVKGGNVMSASVALLAGLLVAMGVSYFTGAQAYGMDELLFLVLVFLAVSAVLLVVMYLLGEKARNATPVVLGIAIGGTVMIITYFLGEWLLLDMGFGKALLEVPINVLQVTLGGTIGALLSYYVKKSYPRITRM